MLPSMSKDELRRLCHPLLPGQRVREHGNSRVMQVVGGHWKTGEIICVWHEGSKQHFEKFDWDELQRVRN